MESPRVGPSSRFLSNIFTDKNGQGVLTMMGTKDILQDIFDRNIVVGTPNIKKCASVIHTLALVEEYIETTLSKDTIPETTDDNTVGRIGPNLVKFTYARHGHFIVSADMLSINSQSSFATIRANTAVYKGKWMYEVQLGSKGVMQLGWSMTDCKFNEEIGVGDAPGSFAYDGNRIKKWSVGTHTYGEAWLSGDIIGCTLDTDNGTVDFYRNGRHLGRAFDNVPTGPGIAYFPTVSLTYTENLTANFGATPLRYPIDVYKPLQAPPSAQVTEAKLLLNWARNTIEIMNRIKLAGMEKILTEDKTMNIHTFVMCILRLIFKRIGPSITVPYINEAAFIPFITQLSELRTKGHATTESAEDDNSMLMLWLDLLWAFFAHHEMKECLENTITYLMSAFRHISLVLTYPDQCKSLVLLTRICKHPKTRQHLLQYTLFDRVRFANFIHVKPLDEGSLAEIVDTPWWETNPLDPLIERHKKKYQYSCEKIKSAISEVEALQIELIVTLLDNSDGTSTKPSSRTIFLRKFRRFVQETLFVSRSAFLQNMPVYQIPLPITLCFFHRLLAAFRVLWSKEIGTHPIYVPCRIFYDASIDYMGIDRLGGVLSHLQKTYKEELIHLLGPDHEVIAAMEQVQDTSQTITGGLGGQAGLPMVIPAIARVDMINSDNTTDVANLMILEGLRFQNRLGFHIKRDEPPLRVGSADPAISLLELLDGIILFYHAAAKKQVEKVSGLRNSMFEYISAVDDAKARLQQIKKKKNVESENIQQELSRTIDILHGKLSEQARHMAWVRAAIFSNEKQEQLAWLFRSVVLTLQSASEEGNMFSFVPDFYLEALSDLSIGIRNHVHPTPPIEEIPDYDKILLDVAEFLCDHFLDHRIVHANSKDTLILALAGFVSKPCTLAALENVSRERRLKVVSNILKPYENRPWAQSNWVLVRFWQGNGFAFRYDKSPHLAWKIGPKLPQQESITHTIQPCPSVVFQEHVQEVLLSNPPATTQFLNFFLNQLNWTFSEFIGMVQEIRNVSSRPERVFIESRQLKTCATCFDLTVALLRVLEMICTIAPSIFSDPSQPSSESLLTRLCQLLSQVLNRTSSQTSCFQHVVLLEIPDLESVDHFPILSAVIGVLLALLQDEMKLMKKHKKLKEVPGITRTLLTEPSFQMKSLHFVLGDVKNVTATKNAKINKPFSFLNYPDHVTPEEISKVEKLIEFLELCQSLLPEAKGINDDDNTCTICYAFPIAATFKPCNHQTCRACIDRHLLNARECFFCKATIDKVVDLSDNVIHDFSGEQANSSVPKAS